MRKQHLAAVAALLAPAFAAACDQPTGPDAPVPPSAAHAADASRRHDAPGLDGEFVRVARQLPGFGGYWFDAAGDLNVLLTDPRQEGAARALLAGVARGRHEDGRPAEIRVRRADYDFLQLDEWRGRLRALLATDGVVFLDTDESANRLRVGVTSDALATRIAAQAERLGVPRAALEVRVTGPGAPIVQLTNYVRPVEGGLEITRPDGNQCTLGFNAYYANWAMSVPVGTRTFFTASHCTYTTSGLDGTEFRQGGVRIGQEVADPPYFNSSQVFSCPAGVLCRWSDVAVGAYDAGVSWALGSIARTQWVGMGPWASGSLDIDPFAPHFQISSFNGYSTMGEYLHKVGRTTGWTTGQVSATCVDYSQYSNTVILCQDEVAAYANYGDSGSPVFGRVSGSAVSIRGIVWRKTEYGTFVFSPNHRIEADFGYYTTF